MKIRRSRVEARLDMTPLIDVVFLLLTFFIFAMVLMVRADVLSITLPKVGTGASANRPGEVLVTLTERGKILIDGEPTEIGDVGTRLGEIMAEKTGAVVLLAADARAPAGGLIELADALVGAGIGEFSIIGSPKGNAGDTPHPPNHSNPAPVEPEE